LKVGEAGSCGANMESNICQPTHTSDACAHCIIDGKPYKLVEAVGESEDGCQTW
jgi:hypothetical protein